MAEDRGTWEGRGRSGRDWPPREFPRSRDDARSDLDRRTDRQEIDRRHAWRGAGRGQYRGDYRGEFEEWSTRPAPRSAGYRRWPRGGEGYPGTGEDWPPTRRPRSREELRTDVDWRTDEPHIDRRHGWRTEFQEPWPPTRRPRSREEVREDLRRRTAEEELDRRHDYRRRGPEARMAPSRMAPPRGRGEMRDDLARRTDADEINRRHDWGERTGYRARGTGPEGVRPRGFAGPEWAARDADLGAGARGPSGRGRFAEPEPEFEEERFDERPYLEGDGGQARREAELSGEWDERGLPYSGGYGGYGGGEYGGSAGGIGPGRTGTYPSVYSTGLAGGGSILGEAGAVSGWEETREMGPGSTASMLERATRRGWAREGPLVRDVMTKNPRSVGPDDDVVQAAKAMREEDAGIVPVVVDGRVVGVVTDRDLAMRVLAEGKGTDTKVSQVMSEDVHACTLDDRLVDAVRVMGEENVRRLPVVDRDDRLLGVLSMTDVAREAELDYALQEALEQLSSRRSFWSSW